MGSGMIKGLVITLLGVLSLAVLGGFKLTTKSAAYATMATNQNVELILATIVFMGILTSVLYYFAHK